MKSEGKTDGIGLDKIFISVERNLEEKLLFLGFCLVAWGCEVCSYICHLFTKREEAMIPEKPIQNPNIKGWMNQPCSGHFWLHEITDLECLSHLELGIQLLAATLSSCSNLNWLLSTLLLLCKCNSLIILGFPFTSLFLGFLFPGSLASFLFFNSQNAEEIL